MQSLNPASSTESDVRPVVKKKRKKPTLRSKAKAASQDVSHRPIAVSIVHVNTSNENQGNTADHDLKRMLNWGVF